MTNEAEIRARHANDEAFLAQQFRVMPTAQVGSQKHRDRATLLTLLDERDEEINRLKSYATPLCNRYCDMEAHAANQLRADLEAANKRIEVLERMDNIKSEFISSRQCADHMGKWGRGRCLQCDLEAANRRIEVLEAGEKIIAADYQTVTNQLQAARAALKDIAESRAEELQGRTNYTEDLIYQRARDALEDGDA